MPLFDMPLAELEAYRPEREEPADFDAFWQQTLAEAAQRPLQATFTPHNQIHLHTVEIFDVSYQGYGGQTIKGWLLLPRQRQEPLPCVVEYIGYSGGRGFGFERLFWSSAGYAHFIMDTRGQGWAPYSPGDTPDVHDEGYGPHVPGFMTLGILAPETYYYRRVFVDAVRAVAAARSHTAVDASRIAICGGSQGGGITLAVSALAPDVSIAMPDVPFLCHYRRATELIDTDPYNEISRYCMVHRDQVDQVFHTLSYFDGVNFAARAQAEALFSVGLIDTICPPSTVYAAYNHYAGPKQIRLYRYNLHEGGGPYQQREQWQLLRQRWA